VTYEAYAVSRTSTRPQVDSAFRGILRRIGEALTASVLDYEDAALPTPAAHLLTNGGRLAKSAHPLTDEEGRRLKSLLPQGVCCHKSPSSAARPPAASCPG
jgi:hypothetical protein